MERDKVIQTYRVLDWRQFLVTKGLSVFFRFRAGYPLGGWGDSFVNFFVGVAAWSTPYPTGANQSDSELQPNEIRERAITRLLEQALGPTQEPDHVVEARRISPPRLDSTDGQDLFPRSSALEHHHPPLCESTHEDWRL